MKKFGLNKDERLKSRKGIAKVFSEGKSVQVFPFRAIYRPSEIGDLRKEAVQCAFTVPKRSFRRAVDRNRLKRQMREVYRLNKHLLNETLAPGVHLDIVLMYSSRVKETYGVMQQAALKLLQRLAKNNN